MNAENISITRRQQEILLRGLRFVRSAVALDVSQDWSEQLESDRRHQYAEIALLESICKEAKIVEGATT